MTSARTPVPVAVIGVGHLGYHHARLYRALPGAHLVGVVDTDLARGSQVAREFGCAQGGRLEDLPDPVRAVSVAAPTRVHAEIAVPLLRRGVDVLVEKPMAASVEEAEAMVEAAEAGDALLMVGHTERFNPAVRVLLEQVASPRFFEIHRLAGFTARSTDIDVILDLMIHDLDLLLAMDGTPPVSVDAIGVSALSSHMDIANARVRLRSGAVANLTASRISVEKIRRIRVFQPRRYLVCDTVSREVERYQLVPGGEGRPAIERTMLPVPEGEPLALELDAFLQSVRNRSRPPVDGRHGLRVLRLALEVRDAALASLGEQPG